jgi:hypothetical protein
MKYKICLPKTEEEALKNIEDAIKTYLETKEILKPADESFTQGWKEAMNNELLPIKQLFETESET